MLTKEQKELQDQEQAEMDKLVQEFLNRGGKIEVCPKFQRSENVEYSGGFWGRRKKAKKD